MKLGCIGCGQIASAILGGIVGKKLLDPSEIIAADKYMPSLEKAKANMGINITQDNKEAAKADILLIAVYPQIYPAVLDEVKDVVRENGTIIWTIGAGVTIADVESHVGSDMKVVRTMPNTCATVGAGVTAVAPNGNVTDEELEYLISLINGFGSAERMSEDLLNGVIPVTGSSPAMVFMLIEAMANGAAREGFPWDQAIRLSAQAVKGSAEMVLQSDRHPAALQNQVCTPGGLTLEMVKKLEELGFRNAVIEAMAACIQDI
jgi:pyrroline-5-carboxylate reductase